MAMIFDVLLDTVLDCLRMLPFLFAAFLLIEALEHHSSEFINKLLVKINKSGPIVGAILGCIPQCGFSVMASNLYSSGIITLGTLLAVFLSTSDEAVLILLSYPERSGAIGQLLLAKLVIALIAGFVADLFLARYISTHKHLHDVCDHDHCGCTDNSGALKPAIHHTLILLGYIFVFSGILNLVIEIVGTDTVASFLLHGSILQPFFTAIIGFIPNCAASVLLTELYITGALSFPAVVAGLCTNAGMGLIVLFKENKGHRKENWSIVGLLYLVAVVAGIILTLFA